MVVWTELDDTQLHRALVKRGVRPRVAQYLVEDRDTNGARMRINATIVAAKARGDQAATS